MSAVFISYAREDKSFVERLCIRLEAEGRKTWIDWEGIPPSAEWLQEIFTAIEEADALVLIISPHFTRSRICGNEVTHAAKHNKRIVPILRTEVEEGLLPEPVAGTA